MWNCCTGYYYYYCKFENHDGHHYKSTGNMLWKWVVSYEHSLHSKNFRLWAKRKAWIIRMINITSFFPKQSLEEIKFSLSFWGWKQLEMIHMRIGYVLEWDIKKFDMIWDNKVTLKTVCFVVLIFFYKF